jgi:hypothetical protein
LLLGVSNLQGDLKQTGGEIQHDVFNFVGQYGALVVL